MIKKGEKDVKLVEITVMILVQVKVEAVNLGVGVDQQVEAGIKDCLKDIHHHHLQEVIQDIINILEVEAVAEVEVEVEVIQEHEIDGIEIGPGQEVTIDIKTQDVKIHLHLLHRQNQQVPDILLKEKDHHHHHHLLLQHQQLLHLLHLVHLVLLNQVILNIEIKKCTEKLEIDRVVEQKNKQRKKI